jgi:hypothetical protein
MLTDGCCHYGSTHSARLTKDYVAHNVAISVIEVRYWLIENQEVVGLTQGANKSHTLLLTIRHAVNASM